MVSHPFKIAFAAALGALVLAAPRSAAARCAEPVQSSKVAVSDCPRAPHERLVTVRLARPGGDLVVRAVFPAGPGRHMFKSLRVESGAPVLSDADRVALAVFGYRESRRDVGTNGTALLSYLSDFVPRGATIERFDEREQPANFRKSARERWTMICKYIGKRHMSAYTLTDAKKINHRKFWVGRKADGCVGRCGIGCMPTFPQPNAYQYTQECFNHDMCLSALLRGQGDDVCMDEMWAAAAGFLSAPDCIGDWDY